MYETKLFHKKILNPGIDDDDGWGFNYLCILICRAASKLV